VHDSLYIQCGHVYHTHVYIHNPTLTPTSPPGHVTYVTYVTPIHPRAPHITSHCRYTVFIPLYPVGVAAEVVLMSRSLPFIRARRLFSVFMPNAYNFAFDYSVFMTVGLSGEGGEGGHGEGRGAAMEGVWRQPQNSPASKQPTNQRTDQPTRPSGGIDYLPLPVVGPLLHTAAAEEEEAGTAECRRRRCRRCPEERVVESWVEPANLIG
jgi:hypothetical protein